MKRLAIPIGFLIFGAAVAGLIAWTFFWPASTLVTEELPTLRQQTFEQMLDVGTDAIYVEDQPMGAEEISVGFAVMHEAGFVVVFADAEGVPGRVIGVSGALPSGGGEHVAVSLQEALVDGEIYYAMLYQDDGDGKFEPDLDRQVADPEQNVVVMTFAARPDAVPEDGPILP